MDAILSVSDYHKDYGSTYAVRGLSFHVAAGQILGLIGRNGAGKTTTLRAIAGIIPPTEGSIQVCGFDLQNEPLQAKQRFAYVPDSPALFDLLTVREHLEFTAITYGLSDFENKSDQLLDRFELTDKRDTITQELSRGMKQKVGLCCAYLHQPELILFDEPLTGLDPRGIRTLKDSIEEVASEGRAVVISSHLLSLVDDMCSDLLILDQGKQKYFGPIEELRAAFPEVNESASLEDIFFQATEGEHDSRGESGTESLTAPEDPPSTSVER